MAEHTVPRPHHQTQYHVHNARIQAEIVVAPEHVTCWLRIPFGDGYQEACAYFPDPEALGRLIGELRACWAKWDEAVLDRASKLAGRGVGA